jgi:hypothetical protein
MSDFEDANVAKTGARKNCRDRGEGGSDGNDRSRGPEVVTTSIDR